MKQQEIKRLLFIVFTLWSTTIGMYAQTPATISDEDYNDANQIAQKYVNAALCGDYATMLQYQCQPLSEEIEERGGENYIFGEDFHKLNKMRKSYSAGCRPIGTDSVAFVMESEDDYWVKAGAHKGSVIARFYFAMQNMENKRVDLGCNDLKLDMINVNGKWLIMRVK